MSLVELAERGTRFRMTFAGEKAKEALGGLVTNDVVSLRAGAGLRAAALTAKGRVIALCRVWDRGADLLVDGDAAAGPGFVGMIRKFVNPRLAKYADVTATTDCLGVIGDGGGAALAMALGADESARRAIDGLAPMHGLAVGEGEAAAWVTRSDDFDAPAFECIAAPARIAAVREALVAAGARVAGETALEARRIARGLPAWGVEMTDETIAQEAALDTLGAIAFDKGCYTGQEVVARIHFRGHVNRLLRQLEGSTPLPVGARVLDAEGNDVGEVRSSTATAPRGPIAIAMLRREVAPDSVVTVRGEAGDATARVRAIA